MEERQLNILVSLFGAGNDSIGSFYVPAGENQNWAVLCTENARLDSCPTSAISADFQSGSQIKNMRDVG